MDEPYKLILPNWPIFLSLFCFSGAYALILQWWSRNYPESFDDNTWLTVVIGVGYVLLHLAGIMPFTYWLQVAAAFLVASLPIIGRSIYNHARHRRETNDWLDRNTTGVPRGRQPK